jgi:hypothetical protein
MYPFPNTDNERPLKMSTSPTNYFSYKWDPKTGSGYRLRFNKDYPHGGLHRRYVLEDWTNLTIVDDWGCDTAEEMIRLMGNLFHIDRKKELANIRQRFEDRASERP